MFDTGLQMARDAVQTEGVGSMGLEEVYRRAKINPPRFGARGPSGTSTHCHRAGCRCSPRDGGRSRPGLYRPRARAVEGLPTPQHHGCPGGSGRLRGGSSRRRRDEDGTSAAGVEDRPRTRSAEESVVGEAVSRPTQAAVEAEGGLEDVAARLRAERSPGICGYNPRTCHLTISGLIRWTSRARWPPRLLENMSQDLRSFGIGSISCKSESIRSLLKNHLHFLWLLHTANVQKQAIPLPVPGIQSTENHSDDIAQRYSTRLPVTREAIASGMVPALYQVSGGSYSAPRRSHENDLRAVTLFPAQNMTCSGRVFNEDSNTQHLAMSHTYPTAAVHYHAVLPILDPMASFGPFQSVYLRNWWASLPCPNGNLDSQPAIIMVIMFQADMYNQTPAWSLLYSKSHTNPFLLNNSLLALADKCRAVLATLREQLVCAPPPCKFNGVRPGPEAGAWDITPGVRIAVGDAAAAEQAREDASQ